jgi:predicted molibdopterin-dependent oxidoreductase YjgC
MLIVGENPVASFPSPSVVKKALASLELLFVADMFMTETAKLATVVLPAASFAEKDGSFTNFEGRVQPIRRAIEPVGNSWPDWEIVRQLASRMGHPVPYSSPQEAMDEIHELVPFLEGGRLGARRLDKESPPSGSGRFSPVKYVPPTDMSADGYPLTLLTGSILHHFGSGTRSSRASRLKKFSPQAWVEVSAPDAEELGLKEGDEVRVASAVGQITTAVRLSGTLSRGIIFMPISFPESPVYELFSINLDTRAKTPSLKSCAVRLERISTHG